MRNNGCVGRPDCSKPQPPRRKPAGTPGAVSETLLGRFQETEKRNMRPRAGSTSGDHNLVGKRLHLKPPIGSQVDLQQVEETCGDNTANVEMEGDKGSPGETGLTTPPKPPDQVSDDQEREEEKLEKEASKDKRQEVRRESPPHLMT